MSFPDITSELKSKMPQLRGRLMANQSLAELTWFRVGGPAQALFMPEDEADLAYFLRLLAADIPVTVVGLGSNLIVRDGGVPGVVIRLGRGFSDITVEGHRIRAGTAVPDVKVARAAQEAGIDLGRAQFRRPLSDQELAGIIRNGIPNTPMPATNISDAQATKIVATRSTRSGNTA